MVKQENICVIYILLLVIHVSTVTFSNLVCKPALFSLNMVMFLFLSISLLPPHSTRLLNSTQVWGNLTTELG